MLLVYAVHFEQLKGTAQPALRAPIEKGGL
jgi:hypothetical protein